MNSPCTIRALFSTALFAAKLFSHMKRSKEKIDEEDVHHSDVCHEERVVKESSVKEPSLLHRKHHGKLKASAANDLSEEMDSQKPIAPSFPPQETELSELRLNSDEHCSHPSIQDAILPKVDINTYPTQNASHIGHPKENGHIALFVSPGERAVNVHSEFVELKDGTEGELSTSMISIQDLEMKNYFKLVCGMFTISCGGFIAIFVDLLGENYSHDYHKVFLKTAYTFCVYVSCIICLCVIAINFLCPHTAEVARIVKFLTWIVMATVAYALALIVCLTTPMEVFEEVAVLVLPILPIGLVGLIRAKYKSN